MTSHCFDIDIAEDVGVNAAIIYQNITHWLGENEKKGKNFKEGCHWTYNSVAELCKQFKYLGAKAIRNALKKLIDAGYLIAGNFNKHAYDKTTWYSFGARMVADLSKGLMDLSQTENTRSPKGEPIPDINTDIISSLSQRMDLEGFSPPTLNELSQYCTQSEYTFDPKRFFAYYASVGWMSRGSLLVDWKAAADGWQTREGEFNRPNLQLVRKSGNSSRKTREMSFAENLTDRSWAL